MLHRVDPTSETSLAGELVVLNGIDKGVARSLLVPVTLIGSAEHCDLRILDLTVRPVHAAVSVTPNGAHLRAIGGTAQVNGLPTTGRLLYHGDVVTIGPVELELHWWLPPAPEPSVMAALPSRPHVRPTERTDRPDAPPESRRSAERRKSARKELNRLHEQQELRNEAERELRSAADTRRDAETRRDAVDQELARLRNLRRKMLRRWKLRRTAERRRLADESARLDADRRQFDQDRKHFDDRRRHLEEALRESEGKLDDCRKRRTALERELSNLRTEWGRRAAELGQAETKLRADRTEWEAVRGNLRREVGDLERRIENLRSQPLVTPAPPVPPNEPLADDERLRRLGESAGALEDQRRALGEIVAGFTESAEWVRGLEETARALIEREQAVQAWEEAIIRREAEVAVREGTVLLSDAEYARRTAESAERTARLVAREAELEELLRRVRDRLTAESAELRREIERTLLMRARSATVLERQDQERQSLWDRREAVAAEALINETCRRELLRSEPGAAEKIERLERRLAALHQGRRAEWESRIQDIRAESAALEDLLVRVTERMDETARRESALILAVNERDRRRFAEVGPPPVAVPRDPRWEELLAELNRLTDLLTSSPPSASAHTGPRLAA